jgi:methionyl-tRNA formyltransferase
VYVLLKSPLELPLISNSSTKASRADALRPSARNTRGRPRAYHMASSFSLCLNNSAYLLTFPQPPSFTGNDSSDALVTASFGRAVPAHILSRFDPSLRLNIHPSLLPKYRGAAPIQRTLINDETLTGVSILQMEDVSMHGFDAGPVWAQRGVVRSLVHITRTFP